MLSLRPSCCCSELTALISLTCVNTSGPTHAPKYAPRVGGTGARAGFTLVVTCGAGANGRGDDENGLVTTTATTADTTTRARARRILRFTGSDPVPVRVELPQHDLTRHHPSPDRHRE